MSYTPPTSVTPNIGSQLNLNYSNTVVPAGALAANVTFQSFLQYATGIAAGQVNVVGFGQYTISASATKNIFLGTSTPTLSDDYGQLTQFARVKGMAIYLTGGASGVASSISWGSTGTHPFLFSLTGTTPLYTIVNSTLGGVFHGFHADATGYVITTGTNDQLNILNNDGSNAATVTVCVVGGAT